MSARPRGPSQPEEAGAEGFHPIIIGKRDHVEVRGMTEDLDGFDVVLCEEDMADLAAHPRFGVISQTTQPIEKVRQLVRSSARTVSPIRRAFH